MAIRVEQRIHANSHMINRRESCRIKRTLFLNGVKPIGFLFSSKGEVFHLIKNEEECFCGRLLSKMNPLIKFKTLEEASDRSNFFGRKLCIHCENNIIGLSRKEKYKNNNHVQLYRVFYTQMIVSKELKFMLENPYNLTFPRLQAGQLKHAIFLP